MVKNIFILDSLYETVRILTSNKKSQKAFWDDLYVQELDTGSESFEFSCFVDEDIKEGNMIAFFYNNQYKLFTIMEIEIEHKDGRMAAHCYCEVTALELLNSHVRPFFQEMNCIQFFEYILQGTNWNIGTWSESLIQKITYVSVQNIATVWTLIEEYKNVFGCEINTRITYEGGVVTGFYIDILEEGGLGNRTYKRFEYGENVIGITKKKELYDWCTGIIVDCNCDVSNTVITEEYDLGFTKGVGDVILDEESNNLYNYGKSYVIGIYNGKEKDPTEACIKAWEELQARNTPKFDYEVTTALKEEEYEELFLGDTVYVIDHSYTPELLLEARVGKLELSFTDRTQNSCTLTNYKDTKSKLDANLKAVMREVSANSNNINVIQGDITSVSQKADKIDWVVESGTSASDMELTDEAYGLISDHVNITAKNINLHGYVTANNGFRIDTNGNMSAQNGTFSGTITGSAIRGSSNFYTAPNADAEEGYGFRLYSNGNMYNGGLITVYNIYEPETQFCTLDPGGFVHASSHFMAGSGIKSAGQSLWLGVRDVNLGASSNFNVELTHQGDGNVYLRPGYNAQSRLGHSAYMWHTVYSANGISSSSDRTMKENIRYLNTSENARAVQSDITEQDLYDFVRDDLITAQYNFIGEDKTHIGFIAQDLLYNMDGSDNIIGQMIVNKPDEEQSNLSYNEKIYVNILAGALRKAIHKIEVLEEKVRLLEE